MWRTMGRAIGLGGLLVAGALAARPADAQNPRFVRDFVADTQGILAEVDATRKQFEAELADPARQGRPPAADPQKATERFQQTFGGTMEKFGVRVKKLNENRRRAERTLSQKEAQFTGEVYGDLMKIMQRLAASQVQLTEPPARRAAFFEEVGKQAETLRKKLQAYP